MNRIAGIFRLDNSPVQSAEIDDMIDSLKMHSSNSGQSRIEGMVGFGRVSYGCSGNVLVEPPVPLILISPNKEYMITFDGRIDNREELLAILRPEVLSNGMGITDEQLVLMAYKHWDADCPRHLIGDFAFAIWDKSKHLLMCVRDHLGNKPLFYSFQQGILVFASTPMAILASGIVRTELNEDRIADHLVNPLEGVDKTSSFYRGIFRLPPGHNMIVRPEGENIECYWQVSTTKQWDGYMGSDILDAFRSLLADSIRCRLTGVSSRASMLSGGMDSSAIVGMGRASAASEGGQPFNVFAVVSNSSGLNRETGYIFSMLQQNDLRAHLISEAEIRSWMDRLVHAIESEMEPFDCLMNLNRSIYLHAGDQGFGAMLDGIDGDTLLADSGYLLPLWQKLNLQALVNETIQAEGLIAEYRMGWRMLIGSLFSLASIFAPDWMQSLRRQYHSREAVPNAVRDTIIDGEFANQSRLGERFALLDSYRPKLQTFDQMEFHKIALHHPFLTVGLERYERVASQFGIEATHPFTDIRLVEFCLGLPWNLKTRRGWTKYILRQVMASYLPADVVWRRDKDSLMWEVNRLILKERADYFHQATLDEREVLKPYVNTQKLEKFWQEYLTHGEEKNAAQIWSGIALAFWLRRHRNMIRDLKLHR